MIGERRQRLAFVLWDGDIGGTEVLNAALAQRMRRHGAEVTIVFVGRPEPLADRLAGTGVEYRSLGFRRGRNVVPHARRFARVVSDAGPDGALLVECGFMGATLRAGGYRGPIVGVENGTLNGLPGLSRSRRLLWRTSRLAGARAHDLEVAVSDFMLEQMRGHPHARRLARIYNGIDPGESLPALSASHDRGRDGMTVGFMGRLVGGKGADHLIRALARARGLLRARLLIAGDGPERARLAALADSLDLGTDVVFLGVVDDVPAFWRQCDIAAVPAAELAEAFSMVTLEAMVAGKPIVATRNGAIPELVADGVSGTLVAPGDVGALAEALVAYAENAALRDAHGAAARAQAVTRFHIDDCARAYVEVFDRFATSLSARSGTQTDDGTP